jgi:hypothetical protein
MEIIIDQRIECLAVIQTLCGYWDDFLQKYFKKSHFQCGYIDEVKKYFEKYKDHKTIKLFNHLCKENPDISHYFQFVFILGHSELPELKSITNYYYDDYEYKLSQDNNWKEFVDSMKIFYEETNFKYFFESNKNEYKKVISDFGDINKTNSKYIFDYLDVKDNSNYKVIISPLIMGLYGIAIKINETEKVNYPIMSPNDYQNNKYIYDYGEPINHILWHEIGHTVINDLTDKYINEFDIENLNVPEEIKKIGYIGKTVINEYIIRAITYKLIELFEDDNSAVFQLELEAKFGFTEIKKIKMFIEKNCEENNKLLKDDNYKKLIDYVINILITVSYS